MIYSLYIVNKAGGLVYQKDFTDHLEKMSSNEYLVLAGTFPRVKRVLVNVSLNRDRVHAITSKISPVHNSSGIELLEAENFKLYCFQTLTGQIVDAFNPKLTLTQEQNSYSLQHQNKRISTLG